MSGFTRVGKVIIDNRIFTAKFCCDYEKCHGACCNEPTDEELLGCDLSDYEAAMVLFHRKAVAEFCSEKDKELVREAPLEITNGTFYTRLDGDRCVLCNMDERTCALKKLHEHIKEVDIPLSCHLYPILWTIDVAGMDRFVLGDVFPDWCKWGFEKGEREGVFLLDFLKEPLNRVYNGFYNDLKDEQRRFI